MMTILMIFAHPQIKRFRRKLRDCLFTVPEADIPALANMASPLHQHIVFVNPPSSLFDDADGLSSYDQQQVESWTSPPPKPFLPQCPAGKHASQSWMLPSSLLEAIRLPSGLNATSVTPPGLFMGVPTGWPVATSHS